MLGGLDTNVRPKRQGETRRVSKFTSLAVLFLNSARQIPVELIGVREAKQYPRSTTSAQHGAGIVLTNLQLISGHVRREIKCTVRNVNAPHIPAGPRSVLFARESQKLLADIGFSEIEKDDPKTAVIFHIARAADR